MSAHIMTGSMSAHIVTGDRIVFDPVKRLFPVL